MRRKLVLFAPLILLAFLLFIALGGAIVRELWNWLMPTVFGWRPITFWQALGLLALCRILFGGFGFHGRSPARYRRQMAERWERMTPEERERFREGMRNSCGFTRDTPPGDSSPSAM